ncbi:MAG: cache domain-containing protein [Halarcobacter sp.]
MQYKNENTILKIIKYTPPIFIISISILITFFLYYDYKTTYIKESAVIEKEFIKENKNLIKNNVDIVYNNILRVQKSTEKKLKESLKQRVYEAYDIATNIYNENKDKDKKIITKMIKDALANIRFNKGRGYYYIYSFDYKCILFPLNRSVEGKNFYNFKDGKGDYLTRDIINQLKKQKEGFKTWYFYKPSDKTHNYKKVGFNKYFEPLDWFIGTGEYLDEFEESVKKQILSNISSLRYVNNNYIFVLDYKGTYLSHIKPSVVGKSAFKAKDVQNTQHIINKAIDMAKNKGQGFLSYVQDKKPDTNLATHKTSYVRGINKWEWIIGQGFYDDDYKIKLQEKKQELEEKFKSYISNILTISALLMVILLMVSIYISKVLQKKFDKYKNEINEHLKNNIKQQEVLAHQSKMAAMGEMIGNIAHQWRQPLSVITTAASGVKLNKELDLLNDDDLMNSMDTINTQAIYLSKTIEDFRNFLKVSHDKSDFSITEAVDDAINLTSVQFKSKDIIVVKEIEEFKIYGIKNQFIQVIINILNNAKDELIKLENKKRIILIRSKMLDNKVIFTIQDSAGGIPENIIDRVFEPYFSTKHQFQGTGIGLYMSQEIIVKVLNGEIKAENDTFIYEKEEYYGAKFIVNL